MKCIILARSDLTVKALRACRSIFLGRCLSEDVDTGEDIVFNLKEFHREGGIPAYRYLYRRIEDACDLKGESRHFDSYAILVDCIRPREMSAAVNAITWEKLVSMLVLTFPEVHWIFGALAGSPPEEECAFTPAWTSLSSLFFSQQTPLFDSASLRDWIRELTEKTLMGELQPGGEAVKRTYLPRRQLLAIAVDDESSYAYLNAYIAYRFGYRASAVHSYSLAKELLDKSAQARAMATSDARRRRLIPIILFEDLFLNFADGIRGLSRLAPIDNGLGRSELWPMVENQDVKHRIFVTSDQRLYGDTKIHDANREYINERVRQGRQIRVLLKPYAGMFQLWRKADLPRPDGFNWPPHRTKSAEHPHDHSSSGPLLWIAECLIHRAEEIMSEGVCCVQHAIRGAVLATDAMELLGGRTATASVQALRLKHNFEVLAECQFAGVEHHFEIDDRLYEIHNNAVHISKWFGPHRRERAALNTEMQTILELARVLHEYGHFDEEQVLINRTRTIHNALWVRQAPWRWLLWPMLRYIDFLLDSFSKFVFSLVVWFILTAVIAWVVQPHTPPAPAQEVDGAAFRDAFKFSLDSFVGKVLPEQNAGRDILYSIAGVAGLLHIGAFVALIYSKVTRK